MEEQILKILEKPVKFTEWDEYGNSVCYTNPEKAKEITFMVFEFMEWVLLHSCGDVYYLGYDENDTVTFYDVKNDKKCTKNDVFQYWWDNVKNK